jgi:hypothetical protein
LPRPERAAVLLYDGVTPVGTLDAQVELMIATATGTAEVIARGPIVDVRSRAFVGRMSGVRIKTQDREEVRVVILLDATTTRLPLVFLGGAAALPRHQAALDRLIYSIERSQIASGPGGSGPDQP